MTPPQLREAVDAFNTSVLNGLLQDAGIAFPPKTKEGRVDAWLRLLEDKQRIRQQYDGLPTPVRRALDLLRESGGELSQTRYESLLVKASLVRPRPRPDPAGRAQPPQKTDLPEYGTVRERLFRAGLIWSYSPASARTSAPRLDLDGGKWVYVPAEVAAYLPPLREQIRSIAMPAIKAVVSGSARTLQRDLYLTWSTAREQPLGLTNARLLRVADLKRIARQLLVPETVGTGAKETDFRRIFFLRQMLSALGLLRVAADFASQEAEPNPAFLGLAPAERVARCFTAWRKGVWWNELAATAATANGRPLGSLADPARERVAAAREKVLQLLSAYAKRQAKDRQSGGWVPVEAISEALHDRDEGFLVERNAIYEQLRAMYGYAGSGMYELAPYSYNQLGWNWALPREDADTIWKLVEGAFIEAVLAEGLFWLGLVDLGFEREVPPGAATSRPPVAAVRLTDMGRWLLLGEPQPAIPEETGRVVLQPNYRIFAFDPISEVVLARLDSFANRLNAERAIEYELSQSSVYRAQLAGQTVAEIKSWLTEVTGTALPQNVSRSLDEWATAYERIVVRPQVGWVEAASPELADTLAADPAIASALIRRVSPTGFLVHANRVASIEQALLAREELPARNAGPTAIARTVRVEPDGVIRPVSRLPNLFVRAEFGSFADWDGVVWRITPASISRARAQGLEPATVLDKLRLASGDPLPAELEAQIKAWSRHYGAATVQTLTLVQFRDQDTLEELLSDRALRRLMRPFAPKANLGLATVDPERLEELVRALVERGVEVGTVK